MAELRNGRRKGRKVQLDETLIKETRRVKGIETPRLSFKEAVNEFTKECEMRDYSPHTIRFYRNELRSVLRHLIDQEAPVDDLIKLEYDHFYTLLIEFKRQGLKPNSIDARMRASRALLNWAVRKRIVPQSPMEGLSLPKKKHQVGATFTKSQLKKLLNAPDLTTFVGLRDYVMMLTFAHTGARVSEIADLTIQNVSFEEAAILYNRTKNGKARRIPMTKELTKALKTWFKVRGTLETDALFVTQFDEPMCARAMQRRMKAYGEATGVQNEVPVSPHAFRRTFAKLKIQSGVDVFTVQALMGHSSLDQLKQYVMLYSADLEKGIEAGTDL